MAAATLADINSTLLIIKRNTAITARRLSGKGTSAEEAREGLKERTQARDAIAKPTAPKAPARKSGKGGGGLFGKAIDWAKWFGLASLAVWFREDIHEFLKGIFDPFRKKFDAWWDKKKVDIGKAWENVLDVSGFTGLVKGSEEMWTKYVTPFIDWFDPKNNEFIAWFGKAGDKLDTWLDDSFLSTPWGNIKDFFMGEMGYDTEGMATGRKGMFAGVKEYVANLKSAVGELGVTLGLLDKDGNVTTMAKIGGVATLATLFTFIGPLKLAGVVAGWGIAGVTTLGGLLISLGATIAKMVLWTGPIWLGKAALWIGTAGVGGLLGGLTALSGGFLTMATHFKDGGLMQNALLKISSGAEAAKNTMKNFSLKDTMRGMKSKIGAMFARSSPMMTAVVGALPALIAALAIAGIVALVVVGLKTWAQSMANERAKKDLATGSRTGMAPVGKKVAETAAVGGSALGQLEDIPGLEDLGDTGKELTVARANKIITESTTMTQADKQKAFAVTNQEVTRMGGTAVRMFYDMQQLAQAHLKEMVMAGMLVHQDGKKKALIATRAIGKWMRGNGPENPQPITKSVLAKHGLLIAEPGKYDVNKAWVRLGGNADKSVQKALLKGTFDFGAAMKKFGGLTGAFQAESSLGKGKAWLSKIQSESGTDVETGLDVADRGRGALDQNSLTAGFQQFRIQTDKANLIAEQARAAAIAAGASGPEVQPGAPTNINVNTDQSTRVNESFILGVGAGSWDKNKIVDAGYVGG